MPRPSHLPTPLIRSFVVQTQLATRVAFHEHLLPVCLPPPHIRELVPGTNCTVVGWGKREDSCKYPPFQLFKPSLLTNVMGWREFRKGRKVEEGYAFPKVM